MLRRKWCHLCHQPMYPTTILPEAPDYWMRLTGDEWLPDPVPPGDGEFASVIAYRCNACAKTFRLVIGLPAAPGQ